MNRDVEIQHPAQPRMIFETASQQWVDRTDIVDHTVAVDSETKLMLQAYRGGASMRDIGKSFGISRETVRKRLNKCGVLRVYARGEKRRALAEEMQNLYEGGMLIKEIAKKYRRSYTAARDLLIEAGTTMRPRRNAGKQPPASS